MEEQCLGLLLVGNKCDLTDKRQVEYSVAKAYASSNNMEYFEVSSKTGEQVQQALLYLTIKMMEKSDFSQNDSKISSNTIISCKLRKYRSYSQRLFV